MENSETRVQALQLAPGDNVAVALVDLAAGTPVHVGSLTVQLDRHIKVGHKFALRVIAPGERILKYNCPIGSATRCIQAGEYVHTHNVRSDYLASTTTVTATT